MTGVRLVGGRRLRATLKAAGDDLSDLRAAHTEAARIAAAAAAALAPVRSGRLRADVRSSGTKTAGIVRVGRASLPYAGPIHWGWPARGITAQPFVSEGGTSSEGTWRPVYESALDSAIRKVEGR
ncbi:hypothetical protein PZ938_07660 [Luteipulveratus sp. YIM 133132]|uniref:hypothetical protein n=1 Tax=Luteipulveratus flavus TaxID=3031728 RepID=UPI0023B0497B|nr:hypothetical protein [Luteipulveratus sp. YIM 133132]MDE9365478.1 hypothetical protein [Luteipulveratus sp. YIM 133132]